MPAEQKKELSYVLAVKVYGKSFDSSLSHSYLIDDCYTGISAPIGELNIDIRKMTLKELRPILQYDRSGHMDRRSMLFQEAMFIMSRLPNYYNRPKVELNKYLFGFLHKETSELTLVNAEKEVVPIIDLLGVVDYFSYDLAIVPLSQIEPTP